MNYGVEFLGYAASILLVISFALKQIRHIRIVNTCSCCLFVVYGILYPAYPVALANAAIICLNLYYLLRKG